MRKFILAAAVAGVASLAGLETVQAQAYPGSSVPSRVSGVYPGTYGTYPSQYPTTEHAKKHHGRKDKRRDHDGDADDARYGTYGQDGQYGQNGQYGQYGTYGTYGTYGYPSTGVPQRVEPQSSYGVYNVPSRAQVPQQQVHSRDRDRDSHRADRDR
jgi:hypothetical protein